MSILKPSKNKWGHDLTKTGRGYYTLSGLFRPSVIWKVLVIWIILLIGLSA